MGFLGNLAGSMVKAVQERNEDISRRKEKLARATENELLSIVRRMSPTSTEFAAASLTLQERYGYSPDQITAVKRGG